MSLEHTKLQQIKRAWDAGSFPLTAEIDWLIAESERLHAELARAKDVLVAEHTCKHCGDWCIYPHCKAVRERRKRSETATL